MSTTTASYRRPPRDGPLRVRQRLNVTGDPSTTGTSWTSLRFSKPLPDEYRGHSHRVASAFESPSSKPSSTASSSIRSGSSPGYVRNALSNYQKAVTSNDTPRSRSAVGGPVMAYRTQSARDRYTAVTGTSALHPQRSSYLSPNIPTSISTSTANPRSLSVGSSYQVPSSSSLVSRLTTTLPVDPLDHSSGSTGLSVTKALGRTTLKMERPWRQRMADSARMRAMHGDEIGSGIMNRLAASRAQRRNSSSQQSGDELQSSLAALKSFIADPMATDPKSAISKYRAKNGNPMSRESSRDSIHSGVNGSRQASPSTAPGAATTRNRPSYRTSGYGMTLAEAQLHETPDSHSARPTSLASTSRSYSPPRKSTVSPAQLPIPRRSTGGSQDSLTYPSRLQSTSSPMATESSSYALRRNAGHSILEEIEERNRRRSIRQRTARHNSRQRSLSREPPRKADSSDDEATPENREPPRRRRYLRRRSSSIKREFAKESSQAEQKPPGKLGNETSEVLQQPPAGITITPASPVSSGPLLLLQQQQQLPNHRETSLTTTNNSTTGPPALSVHTASFPDEETKSVVSPSHAFTALGALTSPTQSISATDRPSSAASNDTIDDDESKYNAIAEFRPRSKRPVAVKRTRPVPGMWKSSSDTNEVNISCNRRFARAAITDFVVEAVCRQAASLRAASKSFRSPIKKKVAPKVVEKTLSVAFTSKPVQREVLKCLRVKGPVLICRIDGSFVEKKKKLPVTAVAHLSQDLTHVVATTEAVAERVLACSPVSLVVELRCRGAQFIDKKLDVQIRRRPDSRTANVTVISVDEMDVNWAKAAFQAAAWKSPTPEAPPEVVAASEAPLPEILPVTKKNLAKLIDQQTAIIDAEREKLAACSPASTLRDDDDLTSMCSSFSRQDTLGSIALANLRTNEPRLPATDDEDDDTSLLDESFSGLVLPDKSLLEDYDSFGHRPRHRHHHHHHRRFAPPYRSSSRLLSEPIGDDDYSRTTSPCLSTTSELVQPSAVRINEPTQRRRLIPQLSAPNRTTASSIESLNSSRPPSSVAVGVPVSKMVELMPFPTTFDGSGGSFRRKPLPRKEAQLTTQNFDTPKTPFEAAMQLQAVQVAKKSGSVGHSFEGDGAGMEDSHHSAPGGSLFPHQHQRKSSADSTHGGGGGGSGSANGGSNLAQGFTQAAAQHSHHRPERYAAHIPVRQTSADTSTGRQSTTSVDSNNSGGGGGSGGGVLDTASRQLDQMIDQARYRHHQHRSKFKDAIDYLDQIFEDLKKEVEPSTAAVVSGIRAQNQQEQQQLANKNTGTGAKTVGFRKAMPPDNSAPSNGNGGYHPPQHQQQQQQRQQPQMPSAVVTNVPIVRLRKPTSPPTKQPPQKPLRHIIQPPASQQYQQKPQQQQQQPLSASASFTGPKPFPRSEPNPADVEITETIVLTKPHGKSTKMDFTKQWLTGDIKTWATEKPDLILSNGIDNNLTSPNDSDERSVGSCSAEVAAINAADRRKKRQLGETPDLIKSSQQKPKIVTTAPAPVPVPAPVKPQVLRPQPQYGSFFALTGGNGFGFFPEGTNSLPRPVPTQERARHERASSQDYQGYGSEDYRPFVASLHPGTPSFQQRTGAFQQYSQRSSVSSLHSLSDNHHSLQRRPSTNSMHHHPSNSNDPVLTIDELVADLDLNTDNLNSEASDKRCFFPTNSTLAAPDSLTTPQASPSSSNHSAQRHPFGPVPPKRNFGPAPNGNRQQYGQVNQVNQVNHAIQQPANTSALDEMATMLQSVVGDLGPQQKAKPTPAPRRVAIHSTAPVAQQQQHQHQLQQHQQQQQQQQQYQHQHQQHQQAPQPAVPVGARPFEAINHERHGSRVGAMQQMFEQKRQQPTGPTGANNTNGFANPNLWRRPSQPTKTREEDTYYEIHEFQQAKAPPSSLQTPRASPATSSGGAALPPGSANSSQHGYYSGSASSIGSHLGQQQQPPPPRVQAPQPNGFPPPLNPAQRRSSFTGRQSISSRVDDEDDDGFYDNIGGGSNIDDHRRFSRCSEVDNVSIASHQLPPAHKGLGRLSQLIRRIGGHQSKPPTAASSTASLNKMGLPEPPSGSHPLMKSNSLSSDPWRALHNNGKHAAPSPGLGQRLKQSIFGSRKRL